jgi:hypothetical protein
MANPKNFDCRWDNPVGGDGGVRLSLPETIVYDLCRLSEIDKHISNLIIY